MKKFITIILLICLTSLLTACNNTASSVDLFEYYEKDLGSFLEVAPDFEEVVILDGTGVYETADKSAFILIDNYIIQSIYIREGSLYNIAGIKYNDNFSKAIETFENLGFDFSIKTLKDSNNSEYYRAVSTFSPYYRDITLVIVSQPVPNEEKVLELGFYENNFIDLMKSLQQELN